MHKPPDRIRHSHIFCCDRCGYVLAIGQDEQAARQKAEQKAERYGWQMTGDSLVCLECQHEWGPE